MVVISKRRHGACRSCGKPIWKEWRKADGLCSGARSKHCFARCRAWAQTRGWKLHNTPVLPEHLQEQQVIVDAWLEAGTPPG